MLDESGEYHEQALEDIIEELAGKPASARAELALKHASEFPDVSQRLSGCNKSEEISGIEVEEDEACLWAQTVWTNAAYVITRPSEAQFAERMQVHICDRELARMWLSQERV